ncbi:MAG: ATP-grasp domain-containing protein [Halodesulfurarchaeum sp.]
MSEPASIGVLSLHNSKETKAILNAVEALGHQGHWLRHASLEVEITDNAVTLTPDVDIIVNRLLLSNTEQPAELLGLAASLARLRPMLNPPSSVLTAFHKFATATTMADSSLRIPDSALALNADRLNELRANFGEEAVFKTAIGTHGGGTWKIGQDESVNPRVGDRFAFLQQLIEGPDPTHPSDLRVYVVDDQVLGAMRRYAPENDWRTNVSLGGEFEGITDPPAAASEMALEATRALGLDYAGVDLVEGTDGWYLLEVNPTAGFRGFYSATGVNPGATIARLAIETAGGEIAEDRFDKVSGVLDDAMPSPGSAREPRPEQDRRTIGYTEEILVTGTAGTERVVAKSDTGASRTSLDTRLAAEIGAGPIKSMTTVRSGSSKAGKSRPIVDVVVGIGGDRHTVAASLEDRDHMDYSMLLGRDILKHYQIDVTRSAGQPDEVDTEEEEQDEE